MNSMRPQTARVVLPCAELGETLRFFTEHLGFRVDAIYPADDPTTTVISGYGLRIELEREGDGAPGVLRLLCHDPEALAAATATGAAVIHPEQKQ